MEVLDGNIKGNAHWFPSVRPETVVLDWNDETLPSEVQDGVDFIMYDRPISHFWTRMADVTYNTDSFPALIDTLARIRQLRPDCAPAVLLAYKERHPDERRLWDMTRTIGLRLDEVARVSGACGNPVEIFVGTFHYED
ncbi:hypothetical protein EW145_g7075 [Phellinidium pouzarii]|uniref:Uncharacterized protein n=1 Tax=Phellinidium pouzarii TaxID=167371 RepID=A0A4S4KQC5_9AGAM|nr:hypothetical protein EW145_g7075 [Phellinidium pouzarii]